MAFPLEAIPLKSIDCNNYGHFWGIIGTILQGKPVFFYYFCVVT